VTPWEIYYEDRWMNSGRREFNCEAEANLFKFNREMGANVVVEKREI